MRRLPIKNFLLFVVVFLGLFQLQPLTGCLAAQPSNNPSYSAYFNNFFKLGVGLPGATNGCDQTFSDEAGSFTLTISNSAPFCDTYVSGPNNSVVLLTFSIPTVDEENGIILEISDEWADNTTMLYRYNASGTEQPTINLYSFSSTVLLALESNGADFSMTVSYSIEDRRNMTTVLVNSSGTIEVSGDSNNYVNFQHTWHISAGEDNFIFFNINNVTLNDAAGDFLAIGTGSEVFAEAPALMLTSKWTNYPTVHLNGTEGYVQLFMKSYSPYMGISLSYESWLYTPPTLLPPFTKPPFDFIDAYFYFDDDDDNYHDVVTNFTKYVEKYAYQYCDWDHSTSGHDRLPDYPLVLDVAVVQVVETSPCLIVEFYVDILNGTCLKDILFSNDDFRWLLGNYSSQLNSDFGREVMLSCPMKLLWILAVVIIVFVAVLVIVFVGFRSIDMDKTGMRLDEDDEDKKDSSDESGSEEEHEPERVMRDETQRWTTFAQPNVYIGTHPTAPMEYDDDSLKRHKEEDYIAYQQRNFTFEDYLQNPRERGENFPLTEVRPQLKRLKSVALPNKERTAITLRTMGGINNEAYKVSDDELEGAYYNIDSPEEAIYEVPRLPHDNSSPSTSSGSRSTYM